MWNLLAASAVAASPPTDLTTAYTCARVGVMVGPEDLEPDGDRLLVSSDHRRPDDTGGGAIWSVDPATGSTKALTVVGRDACAFHPHGMTVRDGELWVVVHLSEDEASHPSCPPATDGSGPVRDAVERFRLGPDRMEFVERLSSPLLREPNDLVFLGDTLYVTDNPEYTLTGLLTGVVFGRRPSRVLAWDGSWSVAAKRFLYSNGVIANDDRLVVGAYGGVLTSLGPKAGGWKRDDVTRLDGALDNLMRGDDGRLWVAGHPEPIAFAKHAANPTKIGPSIIYALEPDGPRWTPAITLDDHGGTVQASSTAIYWRGDLWIGQVFEPGVVRCAPRPSPQDGP
jgi:hypothetical protein